MKLVAKQSNWQQNYQHFCALWIFILLFILISGYGMEVIKNDFFDQYNGNFLVELFNQK